MVWNLSLQTGSEGSSLISRVVAHANSLDPLSSCSWRTEVRKPDILLTVPSLPGYNQFNMTQFSEWPDWLKAVVIIPHGLLGFIATWLWWPKSDKGWRKFG